MTTATQKKPRVNLYLSEGQKKRLEEIMEVHGHANVSSAAKYCFQRGLEVTCSLIGSHQTNTTLESMVDAMKEEMEDAFNLKQGPSNTLQGEKKVDNTETIEFS